jgi:ATP-dependent Clp endopeptidase proteolytic subunit ClpP
MKILKVLALTLLLVTHTHGRTVTITPENAVIINEAITGASVTTAIQSLAYLDAERTDKRQKIYIVLNSPGGSIMAGQKLINFANTIENVDTICMFCASMAHAISQGISGVRLATHDNIMMAHRARGTFSGQFGEGELEQKLKLFKKIVLSMEQRNADRIGITLKRYKELVKDEWWSYAQESVELNIVDETIQLKCSQDLINKKIKKVYQTIFGPIEGPETSACPLM